MRSSSRKLYKEHNDWENATEYLKILFKVKNITDNEINSLIVESNLVDELINFVLWF